MSQASASSDRRSDGGRKFSIRAALLLTAWFAGMSHVLSKFGVDNWDFWLALGMMLGTMALVVMLWSRTILAIFLSVCWIYLFAIFHGPHSGQLAILVLALALVVSRRWITRSLAVWVALACVLLGMETMLATRRAALEEMYVLRRELPVVDYRGRLQFAGEPIAPSDPRTRDKWQALEQQWELNAYEPRERQLEALHNDHYANFVASPGFGQSRAIGWNVKQLATIEVPDVEIAEANLPRWPVELPTPYDLGWEGGIPDYWTQYPLAYSKDESVFHYHFATTQGFASDASLGYSPGKGRAAGFVSHAFHHSPAGLQLPNPASEQVLGPAPPRTQTYRITRLQLVSLLVHNPPKVYASESLPRMDQLGEQAATRELTEFEASALERLAAGEDIVTTAPNEAFEMLGAVRAIQRCTNCHDARVGDLLGAFSYSFAQWNTLSSNNESNPQRAK
ncbi:MAG: hypothetical protein KDB14_30120 [Planctomycetales bacterium]|nr:hypothetical protein [Planctomycetales bacterium]